MLLQVCCSCGERAVVRHSLEKRLYCSACFQRHFIDQVHAYVQEFRLIPAKSNIVVGVSGGKDSSVLVDVLAHLLADFPQEYAGVQLHLVAIDEGIAGYRDRSLETVRKISAQYHLQLHIESFSGLFSHSLDEIYQLYPHSTCSFCGILRRAALQTAAMRLGLPSMRIATGHNADDNAETVFMNLLRGDAARLQRCADPISSLGEVGARIKPLAFQTQRDIVMYAFYAHVRYFSTECPYAVGAFRGVARRLVTELNGCQIAAQKAVLDGLRCGNSEQIRQGVAVRICERCTTIMSGSTCQVCQIATAKSADDLKNALKIK